MLETEHEICLSILNKIKNNKLSSLYWRCGEILLMTSVTKPITFDLIESRLRAKCYPTKDHFIKDILICIENLKIFHSDSSIRSLAFSQFSKDVFDILEFSYSDMIEIVYPIVECINNHIANTSSLQKHYVNKTNDSEPCSDIFNISQCNKEELRRILKVCRSRALLSLIATYCQNLDPKSVNIDRDIRINIDVLKDSDVNNLFTYMKKIFKLASRGEISAFPRRIVIQGGEIQYLNSCM